MTINKIGINADFVGKAEWTFRAHSESIDAFQLRTTYKKKERRGLGLVAIAPATLVTLVGQSHSR